MAGTPKRLVVGLMLVLGALFAAPAQAADRVFWTSYDGTIRTANPSGGGPVTTLYTRQFEPQGLDLDLAGNRLVWSTRYDGVIRTAPLDGSGPAQDLASAEDVEAVAVDPTAGRVIWQHPLGLNATPLAGGENSSVYACCGAPPNGPEDGHSGAVDDLNGRVYFDSGADGQRLYSAPLDGSGPVDFLYGGDKYEFIGGIAVDPIRGFVYWTVSNTGEFRKTDDIRRAPLDGSGPAETLYAGEEGHGLAVDAAEGYLYWANSGSIRRAPLDGSGPIQIVAATPRAYAIVLLRTPLATAPPRVSGGATPGSELSCSEGSWTSESIHGSFVYRPPVTRIAFRWQRDGADIAGAENDVYTASEPGEYRCVVTATNSAGDSNATSAAHSVTAASPPDPGPVQTLTLGRARLGRSGSILVPITCANRVSGNCDTTLTLRFRRPTHGFRTITRTLHLAGGPSLTRITLSRKQRRKLLRVHRLRIRVTLTNPPGAPLSRDSTLHGRTSRERSS